MVDTTFSSVSRRAERYRRGLRHRAMAAIVVTTMLGLSTAATAAWTVRGSDKAPTATSHFDLGGIRPTVRSSAEEVSVSWTQPLLDGSRLGTYDKGGYLVRRYDAAGRQAKIGGTCADRVAAASPTAGCREPAVPAGTWWYAIIPVLGSWSGAEGPRQWVTVQTETPSITVRSPVDGGRTSEQRPILAGSMAAAPGDVPEVTVTLSRGRNQRLVATLDATVRNGRWRARPARDLVDGAYTLQVRQRDTVGRPGSRSTTSTFSVDATSPVTADNSASIGTSWSRAPRTVGLTPSDNGGAGVAATYFTIDGSTPTIHSSSGTTVTVDADGVHVLRYFSVDRAGNAEAVKAAANRIRIDRTAPHLAALDPLPRVVHVGQVLTAVADDALSGVTRVIYERCTDEACNAWTSIGSSVIGPEYRVVWRHQPADGTYPLRARVVDEAGNAAYSHPALVRVDNSPTEGPDAHDAPTASSRAEP